MKRALLLIGLAACHSSAPKLGASLPDGGVTPTRPIVRHLDTFDGGANGCLWAIVRHLDNAQIPDGGVPSVMGYDSQGFFNVPALRQYGQPMLHETLPRPHCTVPGEFEMPLFAEDVVAIAELKVFCNGDAGATNFPGLCACVLSAPPLVTTLGPSWIPNGACWWEADGGREPTPIDAYDGSAP